MTNAFKNLVKNGFEDQILKIWLGEPILHTTLTETCNSNGYLISTSETETTIQGIISPITEKDREVIDLGVVEIGDAHGFFKVGDNVGEKDKIKSKESGREYQVVKIDNKARIHGTTCFTHAYMKYRETP